MKKVKLVYMSPKEGALAWVCCFVLGSKAKNLDQAYAYMNTALSAPAFLYLINAFATGGATSNKAVLAKANKEFVKKLLLDQPKALAPPRVWLERHLPNRTAYLKAFQQVLAA